MTADLRSLREQIVEAPAGELPALIGELESLKAEAWARLTVLAGAPAPAPGLLGAAEMAAMIGVPENWVRDKARAGVLPFVRMGHYVRFSPPEVLEAVQKLRLQHNGQLRVTEKQKENRGGRRPVSTECPKSPAVNREKAGGAR